MNPSTPDLPPGWGDRFARARADAPPPVDTAALLRAVRQAADETFAPHAAAGRRTRPEDGAADWLGAFRALADFGRGPLVAGGALACALALFTGWQAWSDWQELAPWVEVVADAGGDVPFVEGAS